MRLNLYVEDTAGRVAYEHLVRKWCESQGIPCEQVRAIAPPFNDVLNKMELLVDKAAQDGFDCIVFVVDQEIVPERKRQIRADRTCGASRSAGHKPTTVYFGTSPWAWWSLGPAWNVGYWPMCRPL